MIIRDTIDVDGPAGPEELTVHADAVMARRMGSRDREDDYDQVERVDVVRVTDADGAEVPVDAARSRVSPSDWQAVLDRIERRALTGEQGGCSDDAW